MEWLKNKKELFDFLSDMKKSKKIANLDNYINWIKERHFNNNIIENYTNTKSQFTELNKQTQFLI